MDFLINMLEEQYGTEIANKIMEGYTKQRAVTFRVNTLTAIAIAKSENAIIFFFIIFYLFILYLSFQQTSKRIASFKFYSYFCDLLSSLRRTGGERKEHYLQLEFFLSFFVLLG